MNDDLVYVKTPLGEEAVRDRTRLVQRNLRMVLILVDGCSDVAAMKQKAGDPAMADAALGELERIGLIEAVGGHPTIPAETFNIPTLTAYTALGADPEPQFDKSSSTPSQTVFSAEPAGLTPVVHAEALPKANAVTNPPRPALPAVQKLTDWWSGVQARRAQAKEERAYEKAYGEVRHDDMVSSPAWPQPTRKRRTFKVGATLTWVTLALAAAGVLRMMFYPYDEYRPAIEAQLSRVLGDTVTVGKVRGTLTPLPTLVLEGVRVGADGYATADAILLAPELLSLTSGDRYREISVSGLRMRDSGLARLPAWFADPTAAPVQPGRVRFDNATLDLGWTSIGQLSGEFAFGGQQSSPHFMVRASRGPFTAQAVPVTSGLKVTVSSAKSSIASSPPLAVDGMDLSGTLSPGRLVVDSVSARMFGGLLAGSGLIAWNSDPGIVLKLTLEHADAEKLLGTLNGPDLVKGSTSAEMTLASTVLSSAWLGQAARMEGTVSVQQGSLKHIDLAGTLQSAGAQGRGVHGADTRFEELSGKFSVDGQSCRLNGLRLSSGLMTGSGQVTFSRQNGTLTGTANVEMRGTARAPRALVTIAGNASRPELRATR